MRRLTLLIVLSLVACFALGADRIYLHHAPITDLNQRSKILGLDQALNLGPSAGLNQLTRHCFSADWVVTRYQQTYKGVPIWGNNIIVVHDAEGIAELHGTAVTGIAADLITVKPSFSAEAALRRTRLLFGDEGNQKGYVYDNEHSDLVIYANDGKAKLAYAVSYFVDKIKGGSPKRPCFIIDALNGELLFEYDGLTTDHVGTGPGGNQKIGSYEYGSGGSPFLDVEVNGNIHTMERPLFRTVNLNHATSGTSAFTYTGPRNTVKQCNGAYSPLNDAHQFSEVVFNMYNDWYGVSPLIDQLFVRVHYSNNYAGAFYINNTVNFGDGNSEYHPFVSLDVVAHEIAHGFTEATSGLIYANQSGAIAEAFSDMAGEAAEFFRRRYNDFLVGNDIRKTGALRYMSNPTLDGHSIGSALDYVDGMDVHYSSGVYNRAFFILANTDGWNTQMAFDVFYRAQFLWDASTTFIQGRDGCLAAANALNYDTDDVQDAFAAVDIGTWSGKNRKPTAGFSYSTFMLTTDFQDASSDPDGFIVTHSWSFGDGASSFAVNPVHTYADPGTYTVNLTVVDNNGAYHSTETAVIVGITY